MAESTLIAVARFCRVSVLPEQSPGLCKVVHKDFQTIKLGDAVELEVPRSGLHLQSNQFDCYQNSPTLTREFNRPAGTILPVNNPVFVDVQDACSDTVSLSLGIAEQCERHEKILRFISSGSSYLDGGDLNLSALHDLMRLHTSSFANPPSYHMNGYFSLYEAGNDIDHSVLYPQKELYSPKSLTDSIDDFAFYPRATTHANDQVLFNCSDTEMKEWFATMAEIAKKYDRGIQRREMVVPYFRRSSRKVRSNTQGSLKFQDAVAPVKSPEEIKSRPLPKKKQSKKVGSEKHIYRNNYSYVCESLLSLVFSKNSDKNAYLSLKKNNHELFQLLTQFSAGIAGTGLAVLFSVIWKLGNGRAALCAPRVLSAGLALGLFWLSFSINSLRDTIVESTKNLSNMRLKENEIMDRVERSAKEVFIRAAAVMAVAILRFV